MGTGLSVCSAPTDQDNAKAAANVASKTSASASVNAHADTNAKVNTDTKANASADTDAKVNTDTKANAYADKGSEMAGDLAPVRTSSALEADDGFTEARQHDPHVKKSASRRLRQMSTMLRNTLVVAQLQDPLSPTRFKLPEEPLVEGPELTPAGEATLRSHVADCVEGRGGDMSALQRAAKLGEAYLSLDSSGRLAFLRMLLRHFGPCEARIDAAIEAMAAARSAADPGAMDKACQGMREALTPPWLKLLKMFNSGTFGGATGVKFLIDLRQDLLGQLKAAPELRPLDRDLQDLLGTWFDIGCLQLERLDWGSPARALQKLMQYEAVHKIASWEDLRHRLEGDRRVYAYFHPRMPLEPLIFVEVALMEEVPSSVQLVLDPSPALDTATDRATTAVFYSISNTQAGLRGVSFGNFLIKKVVQSLTAALPHLRTFVTLSPIPGFLKWLREGAASEEGRERLTAAAHLAPDALDVATVEAAAAGEKVEGLGDLAGLVARVHLPERPALAEAVAPVLLRLAAAFLLTARTAQGLPADPVARFHLNNGAYIHRLNWLGDTSAKGHAQSATLMVNYMYDPAQIEVNHESLATSGIIAAAPEVRALIAPAHRATV